MSFLLILAFQAGAASAAEGTPPSASLAEDQVRVLLAPALETTLASAMAGRIAAVKVGLGNSFVAGATLVRFDCDEQQARLEMVKAELASAHQVHESKRRLMELKQAGKVEVAIAASNLEKA